MTEVTPVPINTPHLNIVTTPKLPAVDSMSERELLAELVTNVRELRAVIDPIIDNPAALFANMGPMAGMLAGMFGGKR